MFQSTHPHGVRQRYVIMQIQGKQFQSTHPHGVRQKRSGANPRRLRFNPRTHTGCDVSLGYLWRLELVSIHAPTRGATSFRISSATISEMFQSTHPHGVRLCRCTFQSTHPHGVRLCRCTFLRCRLKFQSTHPHGVRRQVDPPSQRASSFNPRTHTGCDTERRYH